MKSLLTAAAGAALLGLVSGAASAQTVVAATTDLNVRSGPGPSYPVVAVIAADGAATLRGCIQGSKWCEVDAGGISGWAYGDYLTADVSGSRVVIAEGGAGFETPAVVYEEAPAGGTVVVERPVAGTIVRGTAGAAVVPSDTVVTYVRGNAVEPVYLEGEAVVGSRLPDTVELQTIPDYDYDYVYVNGQPVLVEPATRQVVYVVR
ncbi:DUF1236 domain-containing protein [Mangrovicella endophytica]|uniref:DUF1236 domain-containing protein n=1 Tax=Mangrovicella endophytica TaxID=2066697 RepID=UPI000C9E6442|nr:DUF1236 domain-containing protein [Mangrovicella endophytica]